MFQDGNKVPVDFETPHIGFSGSPCSRSGYTHRSPDMFIVNVFPKRRTQKPSRKSLHNHVKQRASSLHRTAIVPWVRVGCK